MTKDFVDVMSLIPAERVGDTRQPDNAAPSLHSHYKSFIATTSSPAPRPGIGILPRGFCHLSFPFPSRAKFSLIFYTMVSEVIDSQHVAVLKMV
jgi:hypothetical protein